MEISNQKEHRTLTKVFKEKLSGYTFEKKIFILFLLVVAFSVGWIIGSVMMVKIGERLAVKFLDIQLNGHAMEIYRAYAWKL